MSYGIGTGFGFGNSGGGGGGGGTVDNSTPPYFIYKDPDGTFRNAPMLWTFPFDGFNVVRTEVQDFRFAMTDQEENEHTSQVVFHPQSIEMAFNVDGNLQNFFNLSKLNGSADQSFDVTIGNDLTRFDLYANGDNGRLDITALTGIILYVGGPTGAGSETANFTLEGNIAAINFDVNTVKTPFFSLEKTGGNTDTSFNALIGSETCYISMIDIIDDTENIVISGDFGVNVKSRKGGGIVCMSGSPDFPLTSYTILSLDTTTLIISNALPSQEPQVYLGFQFFSGESIPVGSYSFAVNGGQVGGGTGLHLVSDIFSGNDIAALGNYAFQQPGATNFIFVSQPTDNRGEMIKLNSTKIILEGLQQFANNAAAAAVLPANAIYYTTDIVTGNKVLSIV